MSQPEQKRFVLPNVTASRLNLSYVPFHWPSSYTFPEYGGFSIQQPRVGWLQKLLAPHHDQWIETDCVAALVPDAGGRNFSLFVNGVSLTDSLEESLRLHKLMRQRKMALLVTTCNARISGGGTLLDGRRRGYGVEFDVAALRELDALKRQRNKEKRDLFQRFRVRAIADVYKNKVYASFGNRCFKCGANEKPKQEIGKPPVLCLDHHIPMALVGHLVPGNIVALCRKCNNAKLDKAPEEFYTQDELRKLVPFLELQEEIFRFDFDSDQWHGNRENYLLSLGVEPKKVHEILYNELDPDFVGFRTESPNITISIDISGLTKDNEIR
jgi:hypothetical protein